MWRVTILCLAALVVCAAPAGAAKRTSCPTRGELVRLDVRGVSCATGTSLVRSWARTRRCDPPVPFLERRCTVSRWRCTATRIAVSVSRRVHCTRGERRVAFRRGRD